MSFYVVTANKNVFGPLGQDDAWNKLYELESSGIVGKGDAVVARASDAGVALAKVADLFAW